MTTLESFGEELSALCNKYGVVVAGTGYDPGEAILVKLPPDGGQWGALLWDDAQKKFIVEWDETKRGRGFARK